MSLVVRLGLDNLCPDAHLEPAPVIAKLEGLVHGGYTTCVREIVSARREDLDGARVVEVTAQGTRWLDGDQARPILDAVRRLYEAAGTYDSYSWDQLEEMGAHNIQDLALVLDGKTPRPGLTRVNLDGDRLRLIDLDDSIANWPDDTLAASFHEVARVHRLIVHSA